MPNVILVYANCQNRTARGDFVLAGNIARDLMREIKTTGQDVDVILTSTLDGMPRFASLYRSEGDDRVSIDGVDVGLCAMELFDSVTHNVIAFIDANHCKYAPADVVKRVLSPDSKLLIVGAANSESSLDLFQMMRYELAFRQQQPNLYEFFHSSDVLINSSGLTPDSLGLPFITKATDLPELTVVQHAQLPASNYGFMYLAADVDDRDPALIAQYITLTNPTGNYVLVGNFMNVNFTLMASQRFPDTRTSMPNIKFYESLDYNLMRHMMANSTTLVLSTGAMSTLEAMHDQKLTYYQDLPNNKAFVASYLIAVKSMVISDDPSRSALISDFIIELSRLLFAPKPLDSSQLVRTRELLEMPDVSRGLVKANQRIIENASGKLAPRLLSFIGKPKASRLEAQAAFAHYSLSKQGEAINQGQALRRAASWGRLLELKILIRSMRKEELNAVDSKYKRSALHWAIHYAQHDSVDLLISAGALLDLQDKDGKTPLHHAVIKRDKPGMKRLLAAGASTEIPDSRSQSPIQCADESTLSFIQTYIEADTMPVFGMAF
ncbi:Dot/Icm T4SS effector AnkY/LegA9 [Legionella impletisoli]|uniref:Ankyrin-repeat containing protein, substrate of the Dot/Icm secretion system n=1 Tax=Legionella impletisoli TaxID=343510 RepID=A0A917JWP8_9GAMM|nr:Dot/Icm T4SS effector AnkY/LegA9 [Legionella impletisoli]GGI86324.1 hypothetical protein GCM10007966_13690 [Legionella impletisoli]